MGTARQATDDNIIRRIRFACWITKATDTHSEYVILIAFPRQLVTRTRLNVTLYVHCMLCSNVVGNVLEICLTFSIQHITSYLCFMLLYFLAEKSTFLLFI
jgi:hypothetical protein